MTIFTIEIQLYGLCKMLENRFYLLNSALETYTNVVYNTDQIFSSKTESEINYREKGNF